jgi:predicted aldo/keto reductase-like oxidoreductase
MNNYRIYGLKEQSIRQYSTIGIKDGEEGEKANKCLECGICEGKCPQHIEIIKQLRECAQLLEKD